MNLFNPKADFPWARGFIAGWGASTAGALIAIVGCGLLGLS